MTPEPRIPFGPALIHALTLALASGLLLGCKSSPASPPRSSLPVVVPPAATATLPYTLSLKAGFRIKGFPGLHSFVSAVADVEGPKWLLVTGRTNGLHGFDAPTAANPVNNFPVEQANTRLWVLDCAHRKAWSAPLDGNLDPKVAEALKVSDAQGVQQGDTLYVIGGYGRSETAATTGKMVTFSTITAIDVPRTVRAVMCGGPIRDFVSQGSDPRLKVTGGGLGLLGDRFCLVFGQSFDGLYSPVDSGGLFVQQYTEQVRLFRVAGTPPSITDYVAVPPNPRMGGAEQYHRRDLPVAPAVSPEGKPIITAYGGVFVPGTFSAFANPVHIAPDATGASLSVDAGCRQLLSQYECANLALYDERSGDFFAQFFGGISNYHYDWKLNVLVKDPINLRVGVDGTPFIDTISVLHRDRGGRWASFISPDRMPGLLGAQAELLMAPGLPRTENGVIRLDQLAGPTTIGHLVGGILSFAPYAAKSKHDPPTVASDMLFELVLDPTPSRVIPMPPEPTN